MIILYTRKMVTEPVVHFRIEVKLDGSAIARSYDVFIDPPVYRINSPAELSGRSPASDRKKDEKSGRSRNDHRFHSFHYFDQVSLIWW